MPAMIGCSPITPRAAGLLPVRSLPLIATSNLFLKFCDSLIAFRDQALQLLHLAEEFLDPSL
jgi:hypothetical protein